LGLALPAEAYRRPRLGSDSVPPAKDGEVRGQPHGWGALNPPRERNTGNGGWDHSSLPFSGPPDGAHEAEAQVVPAVVGVVPVPVGGSAVVPVVVPLVVPVATPVDAVRPRNWAPHLFSTVPNSSISDSASALTDSD